VLHDRIALLDLPDGELRLERLRGTLPPGGSHSLAISPDGTIAAHGDSTRTVTMWSTVDGTEIAEFQIAAPNFIQALTFSPDGSVLAVGPGGVSNRSEITLWSVPDGMLVGEVSDPTDGHRHWLKNLTFTPDGLFLVSLSLDTTIKVWDVANRSLVRTLGEPDSVSFYRAQTQDQTGRLYGVTRDSLEVRSLPDGRLLSENAELNGIDAALAVTSDGRYVALGDLNRIRIWDLSTGDFFNCLYDEYGSGGTMAYFSVPDSSGQEIWYTLPCDSPLPSAALCTCNCVSGKLQGCNRPSGCSINFTCSCIPVTYSIPQQR